MVSVLIKQGIKWAASIGGYWIVNPKFQIGLDPWADIKRLALDWSYGINTIFDVGANNGDTAKKLKLEFPEASLRSFEPHPATYADLVDRAEESKLNIETVNLALGDECGEIDMFVYDDSKLNSLVSEAPYTVLHELESHCITVNCESIDHYCEKNHIQKIDLLKIDTEGFDLAVIRGAKKLMENKAVKFVYVEFYSVVDGKDKSRGELAPIAELLDNYGFKFIASYCDFIITKGEYFSVSNALFALPPEVAWR